MKTVTIGILIILTLAIVFLFSRIASKKRHLGYHHHSTGEVHDHDQEHNENCDHDHGDHEHGEHEHEEHEHDNTHDHQH